MRRHYRPPRISLLRHLVLCVTGSTYIQPEHSLPSGTPDNAFKSLGSSGNLSPAGLVHNNAIVATPMPPAAKISRLSLEAALSPHGMGLVDRTAVLACGRVVPKVRRGAVIKKRCEASGSFLALSNMVKDCRRG